MSKKLLAMLALVCLFTVSSVGGDMINPGVEPTPTPTPEAGSPAPEGGGSQSSCFDDLWEALFGD